MRAYDFDLFISSDRWVEYYGGRIQTVVARARDGRTVQFAARHLQRFVTREGVCGTFRLTVDDANNFVSLERLGRSPGVVA